MNRSDIKKTPGRLVFNSVSLFSKLNTFIEAKLVNETFAVGTDGQGELDQRDKEAHYEISITPDGRLNTTIAAMLWPYGNPTIGTGIFNDTDKPLAVHGQDGTLETYTAAALSEMPQVKFSSIETLVGAAKFLALRGNNKDWAEANSLVTQADTGGSMADAGFTPSGIITQGYTATWTGISGFADFDTLDGFNFETRVTFSDDMTDRAGLLNKRIKTVEARVRCSPMGPTRQQLLTNAKLQGTGAGRGRSKQSGSADLTITGDDDVDYLVLKNAALTEHVQRWGSEQIRNGDVAWVATRSFSSGVPGALFTIPLT